MVQIKEYRIPLPLSVEEFRIAQLYMVAKAARENSGGGEGVEQLVNEPYNDPSMISGPVGQYTKTIYHLASHLPGLVRAMMPKKAQRINEEAWNAYPYCKTILGSPFLEKAQIIVESMHLGDRGDTDNALNLTPEQLKEREVVLIDICEEIEKKQYKKEEDPLLFHSAKTGRGPFKKGWYKTYDGPIMCAYKLVTVEFRYRGLQDRIEGFTHKTERKLFHMTLRQAYCWVDEWYGWTIEDIRNFERETARMLRGKFDTSDPVVGDEAKSDSKAAEPAKPKALPPTPDAQKVVQKAPARAEPRAASLADTPAPRSTKASAVQRTARSPAREPPAKPAVAAQKTQSGSNEDNEVLVALYAKYQKGPQRHEPAAPPVEVEEASEAGDETDRSVSPVEPVETKREVAPMEKSRPTALPVLEPDPSRTRDEKAPDTPNSEQMQRRNALLDNEWSAYRSTRAEQRPSVSVRKIAAGGSGSAAVDIDGVLRIWGRRIMIPELAPAEVTDAQIVQVALGARHTLALASDGRLFSWGDGTYGVLGVGREDDARHPVLVRALRGITVTAIACGYFHSCALTDAGNLFTWGLNSNGQLGHSIESSSRSRAAPRTHESAPRIVSALKGREVVGIAAGYYHSMAWTKRSSLFAFGSNRHGQLGIGRIGKGEDDENESVYTPTRVRDIDSLGIRKLSCGAHHTLCITGNGILYSWGRAQRLEAGEFSPSDVFSPLPARGLVGVRMSDVSAGAYHSVAVSASGTVFAWGNSEAGQCGLGEEISIADMPHPIESIKGVSITSVACGDAHSLLLTNSGAVLACGNGHDGELGIRDTASGCHSPVPILSFVGESYQVPK